MVPPLSAADLDHVVGSVSGSWRDLDGARIFVTGGTGFIGTWLLESFLAARDRHGLTSTMTVLSRNPAAFTARSPHIATHPALALVQGDVRTFSFPDANFEFIIHGATEASAAMLEERPLEMFDCIVAGTRRVLELAARTRARRFLLISSGAVYGRQPPEIPHIDEDFPGAPAPAVRGSAYGEGKRAAELLCAMHDVDALIARCFAFVGPHLPLDRHFAIGNFIGDAMAGRTIAVLGDGTPMRSYLYAADLAIWLWKILLAGKPLRPYNVGSERALPIVEIARTVAQCVNPPRPVTVAQMPAEGVLPERYVPSTRRARTELGLSEEIGLREAIRRTVAWHAGSSGRS
jgi:nucleoside-diphosphate-sugar epimerase